MELVDVKKDFPIFKRKINNRRLVYLDSAASSQRPEQVIEAVRDFYANHNANIHRGIYRISEEATQMYEDAHCKTASLIGARGMEEIIFTRNTTESLNILSYLLDLRKGDSIVLTQMEHHSNIVPWQQAAKRIGAEICYIPVKDGMLDMDTAESIIDETTKVVSVVHVSNVLGTINDVKAIGKIAKQNNAFFIVDAAQSVPRLPVDVKKINCDFLAFSSHKMLGPTGIGVLYGRKKLLENMEPFFSGGDMIKKVTFEESEWNDLPWKFEAGTPNIAGGIGMGAAVNYLLKIGMKKVEKHERALTKYALEKIKEVQDINILCPLIERIGVIPFNLGTIHPHDVAQVLDNEGIAIRGGHHCAQPLMGVLGIRACSRASFYIYNNLDDIDRLVDGLNKVRKIFA